MGRLIVIDGVDSSGKQTQAKLLAEGLRDRGYSVREITFPNYESDSSALVKMYLGGSFGDKPDDVNPYAASTFYAVDRYASMKIDWGKAINGDEVVIADRYVSSNIIHQAAKIQDEIEKAQFIEWLNDLEFEKLALPRPDITIFLDMPVKHALELMRERANKITGEAQKDIHENNTEYLYSSYNNAIGVCDKMNWTKISCVQNDKIKTILEINQEILSKVLDILTNS